MLQKFKQRKGYNQRALPIALKKGKRLLAVKGFEARSCNTQGKSKASYFLKTTLVQWGKGVREGTGKRGSPGKADMEAGPCLPLKTDDKATVF